MKTGLRSHLSRIAVRGARVVSQLSSYHRPGATLVLTIFIAAVASAGVVGYHYWKYIWVIRTQLVRGPLNNPAKIFASGRRVVVGERISADEIVSQLLGTGYSESLESPVGHFQVKRDALEIHPGPLSYEPRSDAVSLQFRGRRLRSVVSLRDGTHQESYILEPELITPLFDSRRSKRQPVRYRDIPDHLVHAILAIEDHRFFHHQGFDLIRTMKAAFEGIRDTTTPRGTSTLTQQLARTLFLTPERTYRRKLLELWLAFELESSLSKEQLFEHYCNEIPLGRRGSFNIVGVGEAAEAYFGTTVQKLTLAQAALLAGLIQRPSYLNPYRYLERARERRNLVLRAMMQYDYITRQEYEAASQQSVRLANSSVDLEDAPYFVDMVSVQLQGRLGPKELTRESYRVYTTLNTELQAAAVEAVRRGMAGIDKRIANQRRFRGKQAPKPQCVLVSVDPRTGEVKALVGGRDYSLSQLNRALARRQPGSAFKPFVYAAAFNSAVDGDREILTLASTVEDEPTDFSWEGESYRPSNFANRAYGTTTLRDALVKSINIATVKVAEHVGYDRVAHLAVQAGLGPEVEPTPSIALGAYEVTPIQLAGAYTALANGGVRSEPYLIRTVADSGGRIVLRNSPQQRRVLDPRVAYLVTNALEDVLRRGTGAGVRAMGFHEPAAGKTGTDDDGWFVGYTSSLLTVVWVGFDDNRDLGLEGAKSALPIWTDFMQRAHETKEYGAAEPFEAVEGVVRLEIDARTGELATPGCPDRIDEVFVEGTEPSERCHRHRNFFRRFLDIFR